MSRLFCFFVPQFSQLWIIHKIFYASFSASVLSADQLKACPRATVNFLQSPQGFHFTLTTWIRIKAKFTFLSLWFFLIISKFDILQYIDRNKMYKTWTSYKEEITRLLNQRKKIVMIVLVWCATTWPKCCQLPKNDFFSSSCFCYLYPE